MRGQLFSIIEEEGDKYRFRRVQPCFIPNELEIMHKSIIPGVHEIAALVAKKLSPGDSVRFYLR